MKLSQKVRYAVSCLYELSNNPGEYMDTEHLAASQKIPPAYAHKVMQSLAHAGFAFSLKGRGYKLALPLSSITALDLIETLMVDAEANPVIPDIATRFENRVNQALSSFTLVELTGAR
jgi:Rrf2 family protein